MEHTHPLLVPRIEVIGTQQGTPNYPNSPFKTGDIIELDSVSKIKGEMLYYKKFPPIHIELSVCDQFPHLFRKMAWYEKRLIREMPEYLKSWDKPVNHQSTFSNVVIKAGVDFFWNNSEFQIDKDGFVEAYGGIYIHVFTPATLSDYTDYINSKKK